MSRTVVLIESQSPTAKLDVIVGIVWNQTGEVLVAQRPDGTHMAGSWEFPGGKLDSGEAPLVGLQRELAEELGIRVEAAESFVQQSFQYPDRFVRLDVWWVVQYAGVPKPREGQTLRWVGIAELDAIGLLPADAPIVAAIRERCG